MFLQVPVGTEGQRKETAAVNVVNTGPEKFKARCREREGTRAQRLRGGTSQARGMKKQG